MPADADVIYYGQYYKIGEHNRLFVFRNNRWVRSSMDTQVIISRKRKIDRDRLRFRDRKQERASGGMFTN